MYAKTATGLQVPPHDPTTDPRVSFILIGGLFVGGLWIVLHSNLKAIDAPTKAALQRFGASMAVIGVLVQVGVGAWIHSTQPEAVHSAMGGSALDTGAAGAWGLGLLLVALISVVLLAKKGSTALLSIVGCVAALIGIAGAVVYRDGIRDATLLTKGYDVYQRAEGDNWWVIGLFLLVFVIGLAAIGWLLMVMKQATAVSEQVNA
jgi:hypothetical protein